MITHRYLLAVDPASRKSGLAVFRIIPGSTATDSQLLDARAADQPASPRHGADAGFALALSRAASMGEEIATVAGSMTGGPGGNLAPDRIVIEYPRIYKEGPRAQLPGDDLLVLAASAMAAWVNLAALFPFATITPVRPQEWKGQVKKEAMTERILSRLRPHELALLSAKDKKNDNIVDAIGIGLHTCPRVSP